MLPREQEHLMHKVVVPVMNFFVFRDRSYSTFDEPTDIPHMVCNSARFSFIQSRPFISSPCSFFLDICRIVDIFHVFGMPVFFRAILAFIEMSIRHLRMLVEIVYWQFPTTFKAYLCSNFRHVASSHVTD